MQRWDHLTISIHFDNKTHKDWVVQLKERPPLVGLQAIIQAYGEQGWELVGLFPDGFQAFPGFGRWDIEPRIYRATFKRPATEG